MKKKISLMQYTFFKEANVEKELANFIEKAPKLSMGEHVFKFEKEFAKWHKRNHCIMVNSGSSANLLLISSLLNLKKISVGDQVGVSSVTWSTNVMPLIQLGLKPVLIDVEKDGVNVGYHQLKRKIEKLSALFLTNVLGLNNQINKLLKLCKSHNVLLLEDNCESLGCKVNNKILGNFGFASTTSSFVGHHLSTVEGGYVFTDDDKLAAMCKIVRAHGWTRNLTKKELDILSIKKREEFYQPYTFEFPGYNIRPSEINAIAGSLQLPLLNKMNGIRKERFIKFTKILGDNIYEKETKNPAFAIPIKCNSRKQRDSLVNFFKRHLIECRPLISGSIGKQPFWKRIYGETSLNNATTIDQCALYITNDPQLELSLFDFLLNKTAEFFYD